MGRHLRYVPRGALTRERRKHIGALMMLLSAYTHGASAQEPSGFSITLRAPEDASCASEQRLVRAVEARVGMSAVPQGGTPATAIAVEIGAVAEGYRAHVRVVDATASEVGRRELSTQSACDELTEMLVLVVSASIGASPINQPPAAPRPPVPAHNHDSRELTIVHDTEPAKPWAFALTGSLRMHSGIALRPLLGPALAAWATLGALRVGLSGTWLLPASDTATTGLQLRATGAYGEINLCGIVAQSARADLAICLAPQLGALHAEPQGLARATARWDALVQLAASVHVNLLVVGRFGLALALGAALPLVSPRYSHVNERGELLIDHRPELGVWGGLGVWIDLQP